MFRALIGIIIFLLLMVVVWVVYRLAKNFLEHMNAPKERKSNLQTIDEIINDLEIKIQLAELQASKGVEDAERDLVKYKSELEKAQAIKSKLNN
jgi:ABC-type transport system involved in cytochrome bd biosynthesis fused ATPase/permease subunit